MFYTEIPSHIQRMTDDEVYSYCDKCEDKTRKLTRHTDTWEAWHCEYNATLSEMFERGLPAFPDND